MKNQAIANLIDRLTQKIEDLNDTQAISLQNLEERESRNEHIEDLSIIIMELTATNTTDNINEGDKDMNDDGRITRTCREKGCNKPFSISKEEQQWLKDKGLELFTRCFDCRKKRKVEKTNAEK